MRCRFTIILDAPGARPFSRTFTATGYREALERGRDKIRKQTAGSGRGFTYQLAYCRGGIDWQVMETGTRDDLPGPVSPANLPGSA